MPSKRSRSGFDPIPPWAGPCNSSLRHQNKSGRNAAVFVRDSEGKALKLAEDQTVKQLPILILQKRKQACSNPIAAPQKHALDRAKKNFL